MGGVPQQVGTVWGVCPTENFIKAVSNEGMLDYPAPPLATPENGERPKPLWLSHFIRVTGCPA